MITESLVELPRYPVSYTQGTVGSGLQRMIIGLRYKYLPMLIIDINSLNQREL